MLSPAERVCTREGHDLLVAKAPAWSCSVSPTAASCVLGTSSRGAPHSVEDVPDVGRALRGLQTKHQGLDSCQQAA